MRTPSTSLPISLFLSSAFLVISMVAGGCTLKATFKQTTDTTSNITGTTSGRAWWNEDGLLNPEHKAIAFTTYNQANLEQDIARGSGEYLTAVGALLGVPDSERRAYGAAVQTRYAHDWADPNASPERWVALLNETAQPYRQAH